MKNERLTAKDRGLIKGAIRRVFSRSPLRIGFVKNAMITHSDPERPRVTKWSRCWDCGQPTPTYLIQVDHVLPIVPLDKSLEDMTWDEIVNNIWCSDNNLATLCKICHSVKTKAENSQRRAYKKSLLPKTDVLKLKSKPKKERSK